MGEIEKNFTSTCCSFEKKLKTFYYFPDFFQLWKVAGQISRLFQEFMTLYEPWIFLQDKYSFMLTC